MSSFVDCFHTTVEDLMCEKAIDNSWDIYCYSDENGHTVLYYLTSIEDGYDYYCSEQVSYIDEDAHEIYLLKTFQEL